MADEITYVDPQGGSPNPLAPGDITKGQGLFGGQGGLQNQLEMQGVDASALYNINAGIVSDNFESGGCGSGAVPVVDASNGLQVGCANYGSWGGMEDAVQIEKDKTFINLEDVPEGLRFGVLLSGFLRGLEYGSDEYNEASQTGVEWQALLRRYNAGDAGLSDLRDFDGSGLEGWERWDDLYNDTIAEESVLDENADIREILRRNGYDDETIDEILSAEVNNDRFTGNNVLSNALCEIGYSNCSDWSVTAVNPTGNACMNEDGEGTYQNGECVTDTSEGKLCYNIENGVKVEGKRDADGKCISLGSTEEDDGSTDADCSIITQENADDCGYEITSDGQLIPKDLSGDPSDYPDYKSCGGNIFVVVGSDCPDLDGSGGGLTEEDLIGEFGEAAVETAKQVYDYVKGKLEDVTDPSKIPEILRQIITGGVLLGDEKCWNSKGSFDPATGDYRPNGHTDCTTAGNPEETGDVCWKDCVNIVGVLGIPGLPLPPGIGELATVRDLEDFLKGIGKTIGDFIEDPIGTVDGWIDKIIEQIKGIFDSGLDDASKIVDWLKGVFGAAVGEWVWGQIEDSATDIFTNMTPYGLCEDGETPKTDPQGSQCPPPSIYCPNLGLAGELVYKEEDCGDPLTNCEDINRQGGLVEDPEECGPCLSVTHITDSEGNCVEWSDTGPTAEDCANDNKEHIPSQNPGDNSKCGGCLPGFDLQGGYCVESPTDCQSQGKEVDELTGECVDPIDCTPGDTCTAQDGASGTYSEDCECITAFINDGPTPEDCDALGKFHVPADAANNKPSECGECQQTGWSAESADAPCTQDIRTCENGQEADPDKGCPEDWCDEAMTVKPNADGSCPEDPTEDCPDPNQEKDADGNCKCKPGFEPTRSGGCVETTTCPDGSPKLNHENGDCDAPCVEGFIDVGNGCVPQCQIPGKGDLAASDEGCKEDEEPEPEGIDCTDLVGLSVEDHEACGHVQCPDNSDKQGQWFPKGSDVNDVCYDTSVVEECVDESGNPTGAINYPDCDLCPRGQQLINNKCQDPTNVDECTDPDANNYGELGDCTYDPEICDDKTATNYGEEGECLYSPIEETCNDPEASNYGEEGECLYGPIEEPCNDPEASNYGELGPCTYGPILEGCEDPEANNYGQEGPCTYDDPCDSYEYAKDNPLECGWVQCPNGDFAPTREECTDVKDCSDPGYAADNPLECGWVECADGSFAPTEEQCETGPECNDCTCAQYALDNPEECGTSEPPPPDCNDCTCADYAAANPEECGTGGGDDDDDGGGGGGGARGMFKPQAAVPPAQGDPALLARTEFPIVDYLAEALAQQTKSKLMSGMLTGNIV